LGSYLIVDSHPQHNNATFDDIGFIKVSGSTVSFNMELARTAHIAAILMKAI